jgi:anion-transporting  ArsA/GET3 family ATPase
MGPIVISTDGAHDEADAFVAELSRLQSEVREVGQQLDRIEAEMRHVLNDAARERFEEYR